MREPVPFPLHKRQKLFEGSLITIPRINSQAGDFIVGGGHSRYWERRPDRLGLTAKQKVTSPVTVLRVTWCVKGWKQRQALSSPQRGDVQHHGNPLARERQALYSACR